MRLLALLKLIIIFFRRLFGWTAGGAFNDGFSSGFRRKN